MSIFSRRAVQRLIDASAEFLRPSQISRFVDQLNRPVSAIPFEWELIILSALRSKGTVRYEELSPGSNHPDLLFTWHEQNLQFVADITTISSRGLRMQYPVEKFSEIFGQKVQERGLLGRAFKWELRNVPSKGFEERPTLRLCPERQFETRIFNAKFDSFINTIIDRPDQPAEYLIDTEDIFVRIVYEAHEGFTIGNYPAFEYAFSITKNRIFTELEDKASQLRAARHKLPLGILLCDGESQLLHSTGSWNSYSPQQIGRKFLADNSDISFVVIFKLCRHGSFYNTRYTVSAETLPNPRCPSVGEELAPLFKSVSELFPPVKQIPINARLRLEEGEPQSPFCYFGSMTMSQRSIRISARTLLEFLAGKMSAEQFTQVYCHNHRDPVNPFMSELQRGRMITSVIFHPTGDQDDDEVTIEFGEPDPAISAFRKPRL